MTDPILSSWNANARHWVAALENQELTSRILVTNQAVTAAVLAVQPKFVLDVGCGEGWLCRTLHQHGIQVRGIDGTSALIDHARQQGKAEYEVFSYQELVEGRYEPLQKADAAVFNFCLYHHQLTADLLIKARDWITPGGYMVIQTLHPQLALGPGEPYRDGWRQENWAGLKRPFTHPYYWYYRTSGSWLQLLASTGWTLRKMQEPLHPVKQIPVSLLITAQFNG